MNMMMKMEMEANVIKQNRKTKSYNILFFFSENLQVSLCFDFMSPTTITLLGIKSGFKDIKLSIGGVVY